MSTHELRLKINAGAAKAGAKEFQSAIAGIKKAVNALDKDTSGAFTKLSKKTAVNVDTRSVKKAQTDLKNAEKGLSSFDAAAKRLALASASAMRTSVSQFDRLYEKAERLGDAQGIRQLDNALARLEVRLKSAASPLDVRVARSQFADVASDVMRTNRQLEIQERKANIAAAAMAKLNTTQQTSSGLFRAGNGVLRQTSLQLSQVAQQGAVTGDYLRAAAYQIPDLLLPFGTVAVLAGAAVGAIAPLAIEFLGAEDSATQFENRLTSLKSIQDNLNQTSDTLKLTVSELADKYGDAAAKVRELAVFQAGLRIADLTRQMSEQSIALESVAGRYYTLNNGGHAYRNTLNRITSDFGLSSQAAREFETAIQTAATSETFDGQVAGLQNVKRLLEEAGVPASEIPPELAKALDNMIDLSNETDAARKLASDLAKNVSDISPNLDPAVTTASELKKELAAALALFNQISRAESLEYSGRGQNPALFEDGGRLSRGTYSANINYKSPDQIIAEANRKTRRSGGGSRSRASALSEEQKATERLNKSITDRLTSLQTEATTLDLLSTKVYQHKDAATLAAQVMQQNNGVIDSGTEAILRQIDAQSVLNDQLQKIPQTDLRQVAATGLKDGLKQGLSAALQGDTKNFAKNLAQTVKAHLSDALAERIVEGLGIDQLFNVGSAAAASTMQGAIITGGQIAANSMATAISTGQAGSVSNTAGSGGFGILGVIGSLFGVAVGAEGFTTSGVPPTAIANVNPANFRHAPSFAKGTENTSGIPAVLHPNEAVIPLTRGRKVPVDMGEVSSGGPVYAPQIGDIITNVNVETDGETDEKQAQLIAETVAMTVDNRINERLAEQIQYGGMLRPRGG